MCNPTVRFGANWSVLHWDLNVDWLHFDRWLHLFGWFDCWLLTECGRSCDYRVYGSDTPLSMHPWYRLEGLFCGRKVSQISHKLIICIRLILFTLKLPQSQVSGLRVSIDKIMRLWRGSSLMFAHNMPYIQLVTCNSTENGHIVWVPYVLYIKRT